MTRRDGVPAALSLAAGAVDMPSFAGLGAFTAAMSGNANLRGGPGRG